MKYNTAEVAALQPDYLGFIFWEPSERFYDKVIPSLPLGIKKVGVFVDAPMDYLLEKFHEHDLDAVQLHGKESATYCKKLKDFVQVKKNQSNTAKETISGLTIIKVFSIKDSFEFKVLEPYEDVCDYFLFDTKGKLPGGNGYAFDWSVLKDYPSTKPYFLSGGIGLKNIKDIHTFLEKKESKYCFAIDVNSGFESKPGLKDVEKLKTFANNLKEHG